MNFPTLSSTPSKMKIFANLNERAAGNDPERELNDLVEQRHSDKTKILTNWSLSTFQVSMSSSNSKEDF